MSDQKDGQRQNKQKSMSKTLRQCDKRMVELDEQAARLESEDGSFLVDAAYLLKLAKRASDLYKSSRNELKNKLLKTIFSNLKSTNKKVDFSLLKGIDIFFCDSKTEIWLPFTDTFLTNVPSYGSSKMVRMKALLDDAKDNEDLTISDTVKSEAGITHDRK